MKYQIPDADLEAVTGGTVGASLGLNHLHWSWSRFGEGCAEVGGFGSLIGGEAGHRLKQKGLYGLATGAIGCVIGGTVMGVTGDGGPPSSISKTKSSQPDVST